MRKTIRLVIITLLISLLLIGCSKETDINNIQTLVVNQKPFELDNKSIRNEDISLLYNDTLQEEINITYFNYKASEIILENTDTSVNYTVEGSDIIYKGVRFKGLYTAVSSVEQPYDLNTFLNFIIKTFDSYEYKEAIVEIVRDADILSTEVSVDGGAPLLMHDSLSSHDGYIEICSRYNDKANWNICVYVGDREHVASLYGCKSFVIYNGTEDIVVDMSVFNFDKEDETL